MTTKNNTGPLEELLDRISEKELDSRRQEKYDRLVAAARRKKRLKKRWLSGIAAVTVAACLTIIIITTSTLGKPDSSELYKSFYSPHHFPVEYRGTDSLNSNFLEAIRLHSEGKVDQAEKSLQIILVEDINNPDYMLLMSQILMQQEKYDSSIAYLKRVIESGGSYERTGLWYLALSYLAMEDYDKCSEALDSLIDLRDSGFSKQAMKLRRKVKKVNRK